MERRAKAIIRPRYSEATSAGVKGLKNSGATGPPEKENKREGEGRGGTFSYKQRLGAAESWW